jgi:hypothetical protein
MMKLNSVAKSIVGALVAGLGALQVASVDGVVTSGEWIQVASVTLAALVLVWGVPNVDVKAPSGPPAGV